MRRATPPLPPSSSPRRVLVGRDDALAAILYGTLFVAVIVSSDAEVQSLDGVAEVAGLWVAVMLVVHAGRAFLRRARGR